MEAPNTTNWAKYSSRNPVQRALVSRYFRALSGVVESLAPASVLDVGCGEGEALVRLAPLLPQTVMGVDIDPACVAFAQRRLSGASFEVGSVGALDCQDSSYDLVLCLEVIEHLSDPAAALVELARVGRRDLVVSVPWEPWFRLGSLARGRYIRTLGNHPEHVNHWTRGSFAEFLGEHLVVVSLVSSFPWSLAHCCLARPVRSP